MKKFIPEAIVLFSGGLDSLTVARILQEQNIKVKGVCFVSSFFQADRAKKSAQEINLPLEVVDISQDLLKLVKNPPHGHGKHLNPCLDCHALMLKTAYNLFIKGKKKKFLASGEVLGQRPFSQNKIALKEVEKTAQTEILRPLSAKLLEPTQAEKKGWVKREELLDIQGRSRYPQVALAKKYKIKDYPNASGGCLLTEKEFSRNLKKLLENKNKATVREVNIMKNGRNFWLFNKNNVLAVISRNKEEVENLIKLKKSSDLLISLKEDLGPIAVILNFKKPEELNSVFSLKVPTTIEKINLERKRQDKDIIRLVAKLVGYYKPRLRGQQIKIKIK